MVLLSKLRIHQNLPIHVSLKRNEGQRPKDRKGERPIKTVNMLWSRKKMRRNKQKSHFVFLSSWEVKNYSWITIYVEFDVGVIDIIPKRQARWEKEIKKKCNRNIFRVRTILDLLCKNGRRETKKKSFLHSPRWSSLTLSTRQHFHHKSPIKLIISVLNCALISNELCRTVVIIN